MIKQIVCLHISKLTLLGYVIESCSAHKGAGVHLRARETHVKYADPGYQQLSPHSHHTVPLIGLQSYYGVQGKGTWGWPKSCEGMLRGGTRGEEREISQCLGEKQAWESQGYGDKRDRSPVSRL